MSGFRPDFYGNEQLERSFQGVSDGIPSTTGSIMDGVLLEDQSLAIGANTITTGLGRDWIGYVICGQDAIATIYADFATRGSLVLTSSAVVTCNIWVF